MEHMKLTHHSGHEPICGICHKHCRFYDSLREHLNGPLPKAECSEEFSKRGCPLCLTVFDNPAAATIHQATCLMQSASPSVQAGSLSRANKRIQAEKSGPASAVALDCEMVGGGQDGSLDLCARVCLVDEEENVLFQTYVKPQLPVTDYRFDITRIKAEHLVDAMPVKEAAERVKQILYNGETVSRVRLIGGKAKLLVGHGLDHDLQCLMLEYPSNLTRDTSKYPPLRKTGKTSHSLNYLTKRLLGYQIQNGHHDPCEDAIASMRLYKKMRSEVHEQKCGEGTAESNRNNIFSSLRQSDLEKMTPEALLAISRPDYYCWCFDARPQSC